MNGIQIIQTIRWSMEMITAVIYVAPEARPDIGFEWVLYNTLIVSETTWSS